MQVSSDLSKSMELSDGSFEYFPGPARQPIVNLSLLCIICLRRVIELTVILWNRWICYTMRRTLW